jgi:hypothetical protein
MQIQQGIVHLGMILSGIVPEHIRMNYTSDTLVASKVMAYDKKHSPQRFLPLENETTSNLSNNYRSTPRSFNIPHSAHFLT